MRVALLHPTYWPEVRRGAERLVHDVAAGLRDLGHEPTIITSHPGRPTRLDEDGIEVVRSWRPPDWPLRKRGVQEHMTHLPFTEMALRRGRFDVVHAFQAVDALVALRHRARTDTPVVLTVVGLPRREGLANRWLRAETISTTSRRSDALISISEAVRAATSRWLGVDSHVIHPGSDLSAFTPGGGRAPVPTLLCPAALDDPRKRPRLLRDAFALIRAERRDVELLVSRPRDRGLQSELAEEGIRMADLDDPGALLAAYRSAWATVLTSGAEAFGLVLVESLACGTPFVACDDAGAREVLDPPGKVGRLFEGDQAQAVASAAISALDLACESGTGARCRARAGAFSRETAAVRHVELYDEVRRTRRG